jgi:hypothetical protein
VDRPHDGEVAVVERRHLVETETLGCGDNRGVGTTEGQVCVALDQAGDADDVFGDQLFARNRSLRRSMVKKSASAATPRLCRRSG